MYKRSYTLYIWSRYLSFVDANLTIFTEIFWFIVTTQRKLNETSDGSRLPLYPPLPPSDSDLTLMFHN